jgi:hypothetical protein
MAGYSKDKQPDCSTPSGRIEPRSECGTYLTVLVYRGMTDRVSHNQMEGTVPLAVTQMSAWSRFTSSGWINPQQEGYGLVYP